MTRSRQKLIGIVVVLISIAGLVYYVLKNLPEFQRLSFKEPVYIIPLVIFLVLDYFVIGLITRGLIQALGFKFGIVEAYHLSIMTSFYNMILPFRGGLATRAVYLKTHHNFTFTNFLAILSASYIIIFLISSFLGLASMIYSYTSMGLASGSLLLGFSGIFLSLLVVVLFSPKFPETNNNWVNKFIHVLNSWDLIKRNRKLILGIAVLSFFQLVVETMCLFFQFKVFGLDVSFIKCLLLSTVGMFSLLVQITPAGLGVNEALMVFSAQAIAITPADSLAAALLGRVVVLLVLGILGPISSYVLVRQVLPGQAD